MVDIDKDFLKSLFDKNVQLILDHDGSSIRVKGNISALTDEDKFNIRKFKREIIEILNCQNIDNECLNMMIPPVEKTSDYPVSSTQLRFWLISQDSEASIAYNMPIYFELEITDLNYFQQTIDTLVKRHEVLRTVFKMVDDGEVRQEILDVSTFNSRVKVKDIRMEQNKQEFLSEFIESEMRAPFDLEEGPLFKVFLFQIEDSNYFFFSKIHHIICDGWSLNILKTDMFEIYTSYLEGKSFYLPLLSIQYKNFAVWERNSLDSNNYINDKEYWLNVFNKQTEPINLPSNKIRPAVKTYNGLSLDGFIPEKVVKELKRFTKENNGTLFTGLFCLVKILIYCYTNLSDIVLGTAISGRDQIDLENQIGCYIKTLAVRSEIDGKMSFKAAFQHVKENLLGAYSHQHYPFDDLISDLNIVREPSRSSLFDILVSMDNVSNIHPDSKHENIVAAPFSPTFSKHDLTLNFSEVQSGIFCNLTFNSDVYESGMIKSFMNHLNNLLHSVLEFPYQPINEISLLSKEEINKLKEFNDTEIEYPHDKTIVDLFEEQVAKTPDGTALIFENRSYSFVELDELSNQLANYLISTHDLQNEDLIGISLDRSDWVIIAMLAIVKTGGAYVPIDPNYPENRIRYLLEDSNCKALINEVLIGRFISEKQSISKGRPNFHISWKNLVYVIYTSGSTGNPKGVQVENRGLINHINWFKRDFSLTPNDSTVLITSHSFDGSVTTIWSCLLSGATLHMVTAEVARNSEAALEYIEHHKITFLKLVPSLFSSMVSTNKFENTLCLKSVRFIKLGGENIVLTDMKQCFKKYPNIRFANHYGATEATIGSVIHHIDKSNFVEFSKKPVIGSPFDNFRIYILDDNRNIVPIGVMGMIYIAGDGVSRGYLNKKELTKEKFIRELHGETVVYKTGDYGCWTIEGTIVFKGRKDDQVKIRGHRIELGEIESVMNSHLDISSSVVIAKKNNYDENELVAYYVSEEPITYSELRSYLSSKLPEFMLPNYGIPIESIPLTYNGKIDKSQLPSNSDFKEAKNILYEPPTTDVQVQLVRLWEEILQKSNIGINDNFFELGGHSLKVVRLINKIEKSFEVKLRMEILFIDPTIKAIGNEIDRILWLNSNVELNSKKKTIEM